MRDYMGKDEIEVERKAPREPREIPAKICLQCYTLNANAKRICTGCGHEFYAKKGA